MLLRRKTCFIAVVKSVLLQIAALCVTGQFQPGFYHLLKLKLFWLNPLSMDAASSHILPPQLRCFGKVMNYQTDTISSLFQDSQLLPITSLKAGFCCSHPNTGNVRRVQHPFHCSVLYKRNHETGKYYKKTTIKKDIWGEQ